MSVPVWQPVVRSMSHYAHSKENEPPDLWHRLEEHLQTTAEKAQQFAAPWGAGDWAPLK